MAIVLNPNETAQFDRALAYLRQGDAIALPTETVYGLAGLALSESALSKIFRLKARPQFDPLIVHVHGQEDLSPLLAEALTPLQKAILERFWPGALTLLFKKSSKVPDLCTAASPWVAIRSPSHPVFRELLKELGQPLAAPSANRFARISPTSVQDVLDELGPHGLTAVVDGGPCEHGLESTVLKLDESTQQAEIVRLGSTRKEDIEEILPAGFKLKLRESGSGVEKGYEAPGQLKVHYAPRKPLYLFDSESALKEGLRQSDFSKGLALLAPYPPSSELSAMPWNRLQILSPSEREEQAASNLFSSLRSLDQDQSCSEIFALCAQPARGLNLPINDRLKRAASAKKESHGS